MGSGSAKKKSITFMYSSIYVLISHKNVSMSIPHRFFPKSTEYKPNRPNSTHSSSRTFNIGVLWACRPVNGAL